MKTQPMATYLRSQTVPPANHVRDEHGNDMPVLGTLPKTADGCVVIDEPVYHPTLGKVYTWKDGSGVWRAKGWADDYKKAALLTRCYSTRESALAAIKESK